MRIQGVDVSEIEHFTQTMLRSILTFLAFLLFFFWLEQFVRVDLTWQIFSLLRKPGFAKFTVQRYYFPPDLWLSIT